MWSCYSRVIFLELECSQTRLYYNFFKNLSKINIKEKEKNHPARSYVRLREFEEAKYPVFKFKAET